ncbi:ABC transporter ATP-binding protein [Acuticoccus mangrovi]|uniref:ABC transporter ATP-binding protein n=1 Tax=Acuticoccus mangrovi TaxID=2796142 RepID=A0A934IPA1_9HYPH|nr:dipeptide ABC transporter ATP-binding protein [Acuticoccus mangrovi]MBJ3775089.1 ABC transporter ATP-binding protein [Acuticoccus mangrovi]
MTAPILSIRDLRVSFATPDGPVEAVKGIDLDLAAGEALAVVGESGSGKSQLMMAAMGLLAKNGTARGSARYRGEELIGLPARRLNRVRGAKITMIFQEPMTSLDPLQPVGRQIAETLRVHSHLSARAARRRTVELLDLVRLKDPERRVSAYPHELSGGQRQRVMIAMALANEPDILIADEPTTALDVTIQAEILALIADLRTRLGMAILFITHDLQIVRAFCERVMVMRDGRVMEEGDVATIFTAPREDYTRMLLAAEPEGTKPTAPPAPPILRAENVGVHFAIGRGAQLAAVDGVSLTLSPGETVGIVGESGSGKSTLARALLNLLPATGEVRFRDTPITGLSRRQMRPYRHALQMVFQDPYGALSPRLTVGEIVAEGLTVHAPELGAAERRARAVAALAEVGLDGAMARRFPHEFSGGQRQRIAIARAIVLKPAALVLDEPTSALDRSVQKQVLALLLALQAAHNLAYVFISHDLAVIRAVADRVMVMKDGRVVEEGPTARIFEAPATGYTRELIAAAFDLSAILAARQSNPNARGSASTIAGT